MSATDGPRPATAALRRAAAPVRRLALALAARSPIALRIRRREVWYVYDFAQERMPFVLPDGMTHVAGTVADLSDLRALGSWFPRAADWLADGHRLWLARDADGTPVFAQWSLFGRMPTAAARHGWVALPADTINIEDSITAPDFRGRNLLATVTTRTVDVLTADGVRAGFTIMLDTNAASRRGAQKMGWGAFAIVDIDKAGLIWRGRNWRDRVDDASPLVRRRVTVHRPKDAPGAPVAANADALLAWLRAALDTPTRGPRRTARS